MENRGEKIERRKKKITRRFGKTLEKPIEPHFPSVAVIRTVQGITN